MSNNAAPAADAEMQQFQDDLLQSIREFKAGNFACVTKIEPTMAAQAFTHASSNSVDTTHNQ